MTNQIWDNVGSQISEGFLKLKDQKVTEARVAKESVENVHNDQIQTLGNIASQAISEWNDAKSQASAMMAEALEEFELKIDQIIGADGVYPLQHMADVVAHIANHQTEFLSFMQNQREIIDEVFNSFQEDWGTMADTGLLAE